MESMILGGRDRVRVYTHFGADTLDAMACHAMSKKGEGLVGRENGACRTSPDNTIATGERLMTRWGFRQILEQGAASLLQPDTCHAGGISEVRKIAAMAEVYYAGLAPHNPYGPLSTADRTCKSTSPLPTS